MQRSQEKSGRIAREDFYSNDAEKTKLNWFCYEYALEIQSCIEKPLAKRLKKAGIQDVEIAEFCIHYSKAMKPKILARLSGKQKLIILEQLPIENCLSSLSEKLVDELLDVVAKAWERQTDMCAICPTRCISERDRYAEMFDDPEYDD